MPTYTTLKGFSDISKKQPSEILQDNMMVFLDWSFINAGGFFNVTIPTSGAYGGEKNVLGMATDPNFTDGQVWQSIRQNWVWESGTDLGEPIAISGVYVNDTFFPASTTGTYSHYYDYKRGRVVFDTAIPSTSNVELEYSYKWINVVDAHTIPFLRVNYNSHRPDIQDIYAASGEYDNRFRVDLPCVAVNVPPKYKTKGYELGSGARYSSNRIEITVLAESDYEATRIADVILDQPPKTTYLFDTNEIAASNDFPIDYRGMLASGAKSYPQLIETNDNGGYFWKRLYWKNGDLKNHQQLGENLFISTITIDTEIILTDV